MTKAVSEDEHVLIGVGFLVNGVEAGFPIERLEVGDDLDEIGTESARGLPVFEFLEHVHPSVTCAEEESNFGQVEVRVRVGESNLRDVELKAAGVGESELVERDKGAAIGSDFRETDLSKSKRNKKRDEKKK